MKKWVVLIGLISTISYAQEIDIKCTATRNIFRINEGGGGESTDKETKGFTVKYISKFNDEAIVTFKDKEIKVNTGCFGFNFDSKKNKFIFRPGLSINMTDSADNEKSIESWFPLQSQIGYLYQHSGVDIFGEKAGEAKMWHAQCEWVGEATGDCQ